jgi:hypothetical protein
VDVVPSSANVDELNPMGSQERGELVEVGACPAVARSAKEERSTIATWFHAGDGAHAGGS